MVLQYKLHISSVAVDVYGIVSHRDFKFKMDAASQQIIRGVHRDFVVVSILTHQASKWIRVSSQKTMGYTETVSEFPD